MARLPDPRVLVDRVDDTIDCTRKRSHLGAIGHTMGLRDPAKQAAYMRKYREEHKAEIAARKRKYREEHKAELADSERQYRKKNKVDRAAKAAVYDRERDPKRVIKTREYKRRYVEKHKPEIAAYRRRRLYGDHAERLWAEQGGRCANPGCRTELVGGTLGFQVDHDHACCPGGKSCGACVRGLLCRGCNHALTDEMTADRLRGLADYLEARPLKPKPQLDLGI